MLFVKGRLQLANLKLQNLRDELPLRVKKVQKLEATLGGAAGKIQAAKIHIAKQAPSKSSSRA